MSRPLLILMAASILTLSAGASVGAPIRKPQLSVVSVRFSDAEELVRKWTATVDVDASRCAASSGRFEIDFVRLKESAMDLEFAERFTWQTGPNQTGQIEVSVEFWIDEAVGRYAIGYVTPCPCSI